MGGKFSAGFTIIETTLFLAISGVLIATMIAGTSISLNIQRYRDASETFKSLIQQQYAELGSVQNPRDNDWACSATAQPSETPTNAVNRGQSECVLVGKYMRVEAGAISVYTVLARKTSDAVQTSDFDYMRNNYVFNAQTGDVYERDMEWGTEIAWAQTGLDSKTPTTPRSLGMLFVRSPNSGRIYTFTSDTVPAKTAIGGATFASMMSASNEAASRAQRVVCVQSDGLLIAGDRAVYIAENAGNASAIEIRSNDLMEGMAACKA